MYLYNVYKSQNPTNNKALYYFLFRQIWFVSTKFDLLATTSRRYFLSQDSTLHMTLYVMCNVRSVTLTGNSMAHVVGYRFVHRILPYAFISPHC